MLHFISLEKSKEWKKIYKKKRIFWFSIKFLSYEKPKTKMWTKILNCVGLTSFFNSNDCLSYRPLKNMLALPGSHLWHEARTLTTGLSSIQTMNMIFYYMKDVIINIDNNWFQDFSRLLLLIWYYYFTFNFKNGQHKMVK